jgi:HK97 family phage prohead protease
MANKELRFELKTLGEDGTFEGFGSTYHNIDYQNERVLAGAFSKSLRENGDEVPLLFAHNHSEPIGTAKLADSAKGLLVSGKLVLAVSRAREVYELMRAKAVRGLSIGFENIGFFSSSRLPHHEVVSTESGPLSRIPRRGKGSLPYLVSLFCGEPPR